MPFGPDNVFRSDFPALPALPDVSVPAFCLSKSESRDWPCFIDCCANKSRTHKQVAERSRAFSRGLEVCFPELVHTAADDSHRGISNRVLAVVANNHVDYAAVVFGALESGMVVAAMSPTYTVSELDHAFKLTGARYLMFHPDLRETAVVAARQFGVKEDHMISLEPGTGAQGFRTLDDIIAIGRRDSQSNPLRQRAASLIKTWKTRPAYLVATSGTTGKPKAAVLSHGNINANIIQYANDYGAETYFEKDAIAFTTAQFHIAGLGVMTHNVLYWGTTALLFPTFTMPVFLSAVSKYRPRILHLVPTIIVRLTKDRLVDQHDMSSVEVVTSGSAPLGVEIADALIARLMANKGGESRGGGKKGRVVVKQRYGFSEGIGTHGSKDEFIRPESLGTLFSGMEAKIVSADDEAIVLPPGEQGELCVKGPNIMAGGYWNDPVATSAAVKDGWYHTGDLGWMDNEGFFYIVDRKKEIIKFKGLQISPAELEAVLLSHPAVQDACVIGIPAPDLEDGEHPRALVVPRQQLSSAEQIALEAELREFFKKRLTHYKQLRGGIEFVPAEGIAKTGGGKVKRGEIREEQREKAKKRYAEKAML